MSAKLIRYNLDAIFGNILAGFGGIVTYPTVQFITNIPVGYYASVCYSIHHVDILTCLKNIAILESKKFDKSKKYINYDLMKQTYSFDEKRKSIYSVKINTLFDDNKKINNYWYTKVTSPTLFSFDCQNAVHKYKLYRDTNTKMIIGINMINISCYFLSKMYMPMSIHFCITWGILLSMGYYYRNLSYFDNTIIDIIKKEMYSNKKYFYINTFGDIVFTNFKFGLYNRYLTNKSR